MIIINTISQEAFHALLSAETDSEVGIGEQVEWYADLDETILGVVGENQQSWSWAVLRRDENNRFRVCARQRQLPSRHAANLKLLHQLVEVEAPAPTRVAA